MLPWITVVTIAWEFPWGKWSLNWRLFSDTSHSCDFRPSAFWSTEQTRPAVYAPTSPLRKRYEMFTLWEPLHDWMQRPFHPFLFFSSINLSTRLLFPHLFFCPTLCHSCTHCLILPSRLWPLFSSRQPAICKHSSTWLCCPISSITSVHLLPLHSLPCCCIVPKSQKRTVSLEVSLNLSGD